MKMKWVKSVTAATLGVSLIFSGVAFGAERSVVSIDDGTASEISEIQENGFYAADKEASSVMVYGTMTKQEDGQILLKNENEDALYQEIILNITEETRIVDAVSGEPMDLADLKDGTILYAYTSAAMTRSLPPISNAEILISNIPEDTAVPNYLEIQSALSQDQEKGIVTLSTDRSINLIVNEDCKMTSYLTKNIVKAADLKPGTKVLAWYDLVMLSDPAQTVPLKMVVLPYDYAGYAELDPDGGLFVNGEALALDKNSAVHEDNGEIMLPLRKVCEGVGYTVGWSQENKTVTVEDGSGKTIVEFAAGESETELPSQLKNGTTFISEAFVEGFLNIPVVQKY